MTQRFLTFLAAVSLAAVAARPAFAWHDAGHKALTLIAYRQLDDGQKKKLLDILKQHPHYDEFLAAPALRPADAPADEWVVMQASVWPDWVRSHHKEEFNQPYHHYVNFAVTRLDGATDEQKKEIEKAIAALPETASSGLILKELPKRLAEIKDATTDAKTRAVAVCWMLHMTGDIHMPLHACALFSKDTPKGDRGGNSSFVVWHGKAQNLHFIWDGVVGWDEFAGPTFTPYGVADLMARDFEHRHKVTDAERAVAEVEAWAAESRDLAEKEVYEHDGKPIALTFATDSRSSPDAAKTAALPTGYQKRAQKVAEKRVVLAGVRLAEQLKGVLK